MPVLQAIGATDATLALANSGNASASVTITARGYDGALLRGARTNPTSVTVPPLNSKILRPKDLFGETISAGWIEVQTTSSSLTGSFLLMDTSLPTMEGADLATVPAGGLMFPKVTSDRTQGNTLVVVNTSSRKLSRVGLSLFDNSGRAVTQRNISLAPYAGWSGSILDLIPDLGSFDGYVVVETNAGTDPDALVGLETYRGATDFAALPAIPDSSRFETGYVTHFASQAGYASTLVLVNYGATVKAVAVTAGGLEYNGRASAMPTRTEELTLDPYQRMEVHLDTLFELAGSEMITGYVRYQVQDDSAGLFGYMELSASGGRLMATPVQGLAYTNSSFSYTADGLGNYTALALLNPGLLNNSIRIDAFDTRGYSLGTTQFSLGPNGHWSRLLREIIPQTTNQLGGSLRISGTSGVFAIQLLGSTLSGGALAVIPAQGSLTETPQITRLVSARNGGTVTSADGAASLSIPAESMSQDAAVRVRSLNVEDFPRPSGSQRLVGIVQGTPAGSRFTKPARLRFPLAERLTPGSTMAVSIFNPATRQYEPSEFLATVDPSGLTAWTDVTHFTIFAVSVNQAVQITSINPTSANVGNPMTIYGAGFRLSPDDNTVLFTGYAGGVVTAPVLTASSGSLTVKVPSGVANGNVYVKVGSVTSNGVRFQLSSYTNQAPTVNAGSAQSIALSGTVNLSGIATDDGLPSGTLATTWTALNGPGGVTFGDAAASRTTATFSAAGTYTLRLTANDGALSVSDDVSITVNAAPPANQAPVVSAGSGQTITLPAGVMLTGMATDDGLPSNASLTKSWTQVNGPGVVSIGSPTALTTSATFSVAGTYTLRLTANDGALSTSADVTVTVNAAAPTNQTPVVSAGPGQTITLPAGATLMGTVTDDGLPSNGTLTKSWAQVSGPGVVSFANPASPATSATFSVAGTYVLRLTANDGALSTNANVIVTVNATAPANQAPVVSAGSGQTITLPAATALTGTATDDGLPSNATLTKSWTKVSGPGVVSFGSPGALTTSAAFSVAGTYTLRLTANDGALSAASDVVVVVNAVAPVNKAPVVQAGPTQTITFPTGANLSGTATDDGLPVDSGLTVNWSKVSGPGSVIFVNVNSLNASATFLAPGTYTLRLTASDGALSTTDDVVVVADPAVSSIVPASITTCGSTVFGTVNVLAQASDNVGVSAVQLRLDGVNLGPSFTSAPYSYAWNTLAVPNGCHTLTATAQDAAGNQATASFSLTVINP